MSPVSRVNDTLLRCIIFSLRESGVGLVSRVTPVQTALRNCTRDKGGPFEVGNQVLISNHRKLLWSKGHGSEPNSQWKAVAFAQWHEPDESRGSRPESVSGSG